MGFVVYYNSRHTLGPRTTEHQVSAGPIFVLRRTGKVVVLPTDRSVEQSLQEFSEGDLRR
ncbi:hypothetical protein DB346_13425 [Verrucomicrobia bacterium LW23]|nr:hypothetical protein DB346_13425 [Verrucomicrobia bacterium LW23]